MKHKFHLRRFKLLAAFKLIIIGLLTVCVWLVHKSDVAPRGGLLGRILLSRTLEELAYEQEIEADLAKQVAGLCNSGVECFLSGDEEQLAEKSYKSNGINVLLSDKISYNRTPPDVRNNACSMVHYDVTSLPSASVIIIFLEEPYSVLLRTVHSVLNTAPSMLIKEVILVDDFSSLTDLRGKLSYYVKTRLPSKVKLLRLKKQ